MSIAALFDQPQCQSTSEQTLPTIYPGNAGMGKTTFRRNRIPCQRPPNDDRHHTIQYDINIYFKVVQTGKRTLAWERSEPPGTDTIQVASDPDQVQTPKVFGESSYCRGFVWESQLVEKDPIRFDERSVHPNNRRHDG
jgi:hypothetical protein